MLDAARAVFSFVADIDLETYASTPLIRAAVERKFEIIGEALSQFSKVEPGAADRLLAG